MSILRVLPEKNIHIGYTTTKLSRRLTYHRSENNAIKQHKNFKHNNNTDHLISSDVRKILTDNMILYIKKTIIKNDYKSQKQYAYK